MKIEKVRKFYLGWILPLLIAVMAIFVLWIVYHDRIYEVGGDSMSPTLRRGQSVLIERGGTLRHNDIVLVVSPFGGGGAPVFRRCLCLPGDSVTRLQAKQLYGPAVVPRRGSKISLDYANYTIYKDLAKQYEGIRMQWCDSVCTIDGKVAESYTFKRDYVFLVNDNRADQSDSRTYGPVPMETVVAKIKFKF